MTRGTKGPAIAVVTTCALLMLSAGYAVGQRPSGFELALVGIDGTRTVLGQLPPSVFAPRLSPDGTRVAFETREAATSDGARLWIADVANLEGRRALSTVVGRLNWAPVWHDRMTAFTDGRSAATSA